jgi:hypothetical protein
MSRSGTMVQCLLIYYFCYIMMRFLFLCLQKIFRILFRKVKGKGGPSLKAIFPKFLPRLCRPTSSSTYFHHKLNGQRKTIFPNTCFCPEPSVDFLLAKFARDEVSDGGKLFFSQSLFLNMHIFTTLSKL